MRILKTPTEPIFYDAWSIAHAIIRKNDQEKRLTKARERNGIMSNQVAELSNDIVRLEVLVNDRIKAWFDNYGTEKSWKQYLDGHPSYNKLENLLGVSA
jgi:hypothetical protein